MEKQEIKAFFDKKAPTWDAELIKNDGIVRRILDNAQIEKGVSVLDVACGTGVLIGDYLSRGAADVTGVDISEEMLACARAKFPETSVRFLCADAETTAFDRKFSRIMVYNALPHFPSPERLVAALCAALEKDGILSIAHGMSRADINRRHEGAASAVSVELLPAQELAQIMGRYLEILQIQDDEQMYQVVGRKCGD